MCTALLQAPPLAAQIEIRIALVTNDETLEDTLTLPILAAARPAPPPILNH